MAKMDDKYIINKLKADKHIRKYFTPLKSIKYSEFPELNSGTEPRRERPPALLPPIIIPRRPFLSPPRIPSHIRKKKMSLVPL